MSWTRKAYFKNYKKGLLIYCVWNLDMLYKKSFSVQPFTQFGVVLEYHKFVTTFR